MSVIITTTNTLLSFLFISNTLAVCPDETNLFITAPKTMEALSGSCLLIPCNFTAREGQEFNSSKEIFGVWMKTDHNFGKHPENVIFNTSLPKNRYPMMITGELKEENCTTLFSNLTTDYSDTYFFRIVNWPFRATAICEDVQINIKDSPPRPKLEVSGDLTDLKEKESVTITCSAPTPCPHSPPRLTWSLQQDAHSQTEENTDRTFTTKIQQTVTLSDRHDGFHLSCSVVYPVDGGERVKTAVAELTLNVSYAPKDTSASISPSGSVSVGSLVNLTCSSRARPAVSYTWFKISDRGDISVFEGDFYSFNVTEGGVYYCVAANDLGNQTSQRFHLTISTPGNSGSSFPWDLVLGVITGIIGLICLIIYVCWLKCKRKQSQSQTGEEMVGEGPTSHAGEVEESIHYGEIDFSHWKPGQVQERKQSQAAVYAEININNPEVNISDSSHQTAEDPLELYAQVKKQ